MKIGINIFPLERQRWSGIEIYTFELLKFLNNSKNLNVETYSLTHIYNNSEINKTTYKNFNITNPKSYNKLLYNFFTICKLVNNPDIFHSTSFVLPYGLEAKKKIITIHDFAFYKHPELFDYKTKVYYKLILEHSIKTADRIICISKSCLQDFEYFFPKPEYRSKARLVYNGYNDMSNIPTTPLYSFGLFLLCVGASHERKNLRRILESYLLLRKDYNELKIVITGSDNQNVIKEFCSKLNDSSGIIHLQYVSNNELVSLYKSARLLMFPSIYEGFGFPILEAMSVGTPVLTSVGSSCCEISGYNSEFLVDPYSVDDIVSKAKLILEPKKHKILVEYGIKRAKDFSWEKMGKETLLVYND